MTGRSVSTLFVLLFGLAVLGGGCEGDAGPDVVEGQYRLYVEGSLTDTLTGPAVVRPHRNGQMGIELGHRDESGLSLELPSAPSGGQEAVQPGRYRVASPLPRRGTRPDTLSGVLAFLSTADLQFTATHGHLSVTEGGTETVEGKVQFEMAEQGSEGAGGHTVQVTGVLRATAR